MDLKERKLLKQGNMMSIDKDRISKLPDTILLIILSSLKMKDVVATSILSTKWRYLWKYVPSIDFSNYTRDMDAVEKVLFFRDTLSTITKFSVVCSVKWNGSRVNAWLSAVIMHKLEELNLTINIGNSSILPPSLFLCESLAILTLTYGGTVNVPAPISFPALKILKLEYLRFSDGNLTENLSSCPCLEELVIKECQWVGILSKVSISNPSLKRLFIYCCKRETCGYNIDYLKMHAPNLVFLSWESKYLPIECILSDMPSLDYANVIFKESYVEKPKEEMGLAASNLFGALSHVTSLKISAQIITHAKDVLNHIQEFGNLVKLEVDKDCDYVTTSSLLLLPQISPNLASLIYKGGRPYFGEEEIYWTSDAVPRSFLLHLRKVKYSEFVGHQVEVDLVKYLVGNATVLEMMQISINWELDRDKYERSSTLEQFLMMPRGSNRCVIRIR